MNKNTLFEDKYIEGMAGMTMEEKNKVVAEAERLCKKYYNDAELLEMTRRMKEIM
jgi:hypothetical protein